MSVPVSLSNGAKRRVARHLAVLGLLCMVLLASACAELRYYRQSASGQLDIVSRRQAIDSLVEDDSQNAELRERLARVRAVRAFAIEQLGLPDTVSMKKPWIKIKSPGPAHRRS